MSKKNYRDSDSELTEIWHQVPPDYYQKGIKENILQRFWHTGKLRAILTFMNGENFQEILDVGCASGWFLSRLSQKYPQAECVGIDVYKPAIEYGQRYYPYLKLIVSDAHRIPFQNESFGVVICTEVLEHVVEPEKVIKEIKRVLKKNGVAIIEMDTGNILFRIAWYWWTSLRRGVWKDAHIHTFNTKKLESVIIKSGFSIQKKQFFNYSMAIAFLCKKN